MKYRQINNVSLTATEIGIGDVIKVGSHAQLKIDKIPVELQIAFDEIRKRVGRNINNPNNAKLLEQHNIPMSQSTFTHLFVFARVIAEMFPNLVCRNTSREKFYKENPVGNLSELFGKRLFQCAEFATVAQLYLQSVGIDSEYVGGEILNSKTSEFGEQHSFIIIHENGNDFVFDPANNNQGMMPNVSIVKLTPQQKIKMQAKLLTGRRKVAFFETQDLMTNRKYLYGYGDGCNILEDMFFIERSSMQPMPTIDHSRE